MQINNTISSYEFEYKNLNKINQKDTVETSDDLSNEPTSLKNMTLNQIKSYLKENSIEDDSNTRANILFDIQKFANKVDTVTYNKMTTAILGEDSESKASMRYSSFPSEKILDENPKVFNALLNTTLSIEDTVHSLIFTLDFKQDYSNYKIQQNEFGAESDYSDSSFIEFLKKKIIEIEYDLKDGISLPEKNHIKNYSSLLNNLNTLLQEDNNKVDILV